MPRIRKKVSFEVSFKFMRSDHLNRHMKIHIDENGWVWTRYLHKKHETCGMKTSTMEGKYFKNKSSKISHSDINRVCYVLSFDSEASETQSS